MGMDPTFGQFTGGVPPEPEELPPGQEPPMAGEPEEKPKTPEEWKAYDRYRRIEEKRDQRSRHNHQLLVDQLGTLMANDQRLARRVDQSVGLIQDLKKAAFRTTNGQTSGLPSADPSTSRNRMSSLMNRG